MVSNCGRLNPIDKQMLTELETGKEETVNHPAHYNTNKPPCESCGFPIECITVIDGMGFCLGNAIKYVWRSAYKNSPIEDIKKAIWYLERHLKKLEKGKK